MNDRFRDKLNALADETDKLDVEDMRDLCRFGREREIPVYKSIVDEAEANPNRCKDSVRMARQLYKETVAAVRTDCRRAKM